MTLSMQTGGSDGDSEAAGQAEVCCWGVCSLREPTWRGSLEGGRCRRKPFGDGESPILQL